MVLFQIILEEQDRDFSVFSCGDFIPLLGLGEHVFPVFFRTILHGMDFSILSWEDLIPLLHLQEHAKLFF
jgi:hypothetical protein